MTGMSFLTRKSLSLLDTVGGWRTIAEAVTIRALFLLVYLRTGQVLPSALIAVGCVLIIALIRVIRQPEKWWRAGIPLAIVGLSTILAGGTGHAVDFYLPEMLPDLVLGPIVLISMLIQLPIVGLIVETARGDQLGRFNWRRDLVRRRRYQRCTAVFLTKFALAAGVMIPLYVSENVIALGIATTVLTTPALAVCLYLCWRILRTQQSTGTIPAS
ncbi:hypothetical protein GCM10009765_05690 [Fodinicola feengrottensis]|uniref:DUF3159 domain-containing protein n=1 Tax=Fodinicola feengrottensis TaxID=435914 RepID=A0ABP4RRT7_9ACTN